MNALEMIKEKAKDKPKCLFNTYDTEKINELMTYNNLKYGFSEFETTSVLVMSENENEYLRNVKALVSLGEVLK